MPGKLIVCKKCGDSFPEGVGIRCSCREELKQAVKNLKRANSQLAKVNTRLRALAVEGAAFAQHRPNCDSLSPLHRLKCSCGYEAWSSNFRATMEKP